MNGPKPVWMLAMKKLKPSRPRRLRFDGACVGVDTASGTGGWRTSEPKLSQACTFRHPRSVIQWVLARCQRLGLARRTQDDNRLAFLVLRRGFELVARQVERDAFGLARRREMQRGPIDGDLAAADAQKAAEVDDRGAGRAGLVDDHVDNAAHGLALGAGDRLAEDGLRFVLGQHGGRHAGWNRVLGFGARRAEAAAVRYDEPTRENGCCHQDGMPNRTHLRLPAR